MLLDQNLDEPASETFDSLRAAFWEEVMLDNLTAGGDGIGQRIALL